MNVSPTSSNLRNRAIPVIGVYAFYLLWHAAIGLFANFPLYGDEAQYWAWGKNIDWGYYSKPPLIGWVIGGFTSVFGDNALVVRLPSLVAHIGVASGLVAFARDRQASLPPSILALAYLTMPGVTLSSHIISTDPLLLVFYAWAMVWGYRFMHHPDSTTAIWLGGVLGVGFLAKYAMVWFVITYPLAVWLSGEEITHKHLKCIPLIVLMIVLCLLPNIYWNYINDWPTVAHTAGNVGTWGRFNLVNAGVFIGAQFIVVGPVLAIEGLRRLKQVQKIPHVRYALGLSLPIFVFILIQALLNRSHANWASVAHVGLIYALVASLGKYPQALRRGIVSNAVIALIAGVLSICAYHALLPQKLNPYQRFYRATRIVNALKERNITLDDKVIVCDNRQLVAQLTYHLRATRAVVVRYNPDFAPLDYFAMNTDMRVFPERMRVFLGPSCLQESRFINIPGKQHEEILDLGTPFKPLCLQLFAANKPAN